MKNFRWIIIVLVSIFFIVSMSSQAWSACPPLSITSPNTLPAGTKNMAYNYQIQKSGGQAPITFSKVSGSLPSGLNLSSGGLISGTPANAGTYSFTVKATDSCPPGPGGGQQAAQKGFNLTINPPKFILDPEIGKKLLKPIKPVLKPEVLKAILPKIEGMLDVPLGALKPGTKLYLKGKHFGTQPGKILMYGNFPNSPVELVNVAWESSTKVNGVVPMSTNGQPNQTVQIKVKTAQNLFSNPRNIGFEGREEKVLTSSAVTVNCGTDGNINVCNDTVSKDSGSFSPGCPNNYAVCGYHENVWGAVGNDTGNDVFHISLKNGWKFKSMQKAKWYKSSGDETLSGPNPSLPAGQSNWNPSIWWVVSPNDNVFYKIKVIVEGPIGTSYK